MSAESVCRAVLPGLLCVAVMACEDTTSPADGYRTREPVDAEAPPLPPPPLATILAGEVRDSIGQPVGGMVVGIRFRRDGLWYEIGSTQTDAAGRFVWRLSDRSPVSYDAIEFTVPPAECRPYAFVREEVPATDLEGLPVDSAHRVLVVGLGHSAPPAAPGVTVCAAGEKTFGAIGLTILFESFPATPQDSIRGRWRIGFRETSALTAAGLSGVIRNDSLLLHLRTAEDGPCASGFLLRVELLAGRMGDAALDALDPTCAQSLLHTLRFVERARPPGW